MLQLTKRTGCELSWFLLSWSSVSNIVRWAGHRGFYIDTHNDCHVRLDDYIKSRRLSFLVLLCKFLHGNLELFPSDVFCRATLPEKPGAWWRAATRTPPVRVTTSSLENEESPGSLGRWSLLLRLSCRWPCTAVFLSWGIAASNCHCHCHCHWFVTKMILAAPVELQVTLVCLFLLHARIYFFPYVFIVTGLCCIKT